MSHSCRFLYNVFKAGHQAIASAVALNQIGPALPQALRLARTEVAGLHQVKVNDLPREDLILSVPVGITGRESAILARNAEAVSELENLFSWKYVTILGLRYQNFTLIDQAERPQVNDQCLNRAGILPLPTSFISRHASLFCTWHGKYF